MQSHQTLKIRSLELTGLFGILATGGGGGASSSAVHSKWRHGYNTHTATCTLVHVLYNKAIVAQVQNNTDLYRRSLPQHSPRALISKVSLTNAYHKTQLQYSRCLQWTTNLPLFMEALMSTASKPKYMYSILCPHSPLFSAIVTYTCTCTYKDACTCIVCTCLCTLLKIFQHK